MMETAWFNQLQINQREATAGSPAETVEREPKQQVISLTSVVKFRLSLGKGL
jgi:hypothetical protein